MVSRRSINPGKRRPLRMGTVSGRGRVGVTAILRETPAGGSAPRRRAQPTLLECEKPVMAIDSIKVSLREKGVRLTRQRQILLELIDQTGQHLDAERLFQLAKVKDPKLNRVTVYRTLKMLKNGGMVDELDLMHPKATSTTMKPA